MARIFQTLDQGRADRLVVDVRHNGGGNSEVDNALIEGLASRPAWRQRGRLFCLIEGTTFSAAMLTALDLQGLGAVMVGAPTGGKPNSHGNVRSLFLPNSRLAVSYSTSFFRRVAGSDPPSVFPDLPVEPTIDDLRLGRDPLLETAIRFRP
jgi:C-terminal processing protease CtpA/Prc